MIKGLNNLKKNILQQRIFSTWLIRKYTRLNNIYSIIQYTAGFVIPVLNLISIYLKIQHSEVYNLIIGIINIGLMKMKDKLGHEKHIDNANSVLNDYYKMLQRIKKYGGKLDDQELVHMTKMYFEIDKRSEFQDKYSTDFEEYLHKNGIKFDNDISELKDLSSSYSNNNTPNCSSTELEEVKIDDQE